MGLLASSRAGCAVVAALAGCYQPELRDCTVTCEAASDCARGQVCGRDGYCASPDVAGDCRDAAGPDAAGPDAAAPPDAPPSHATLRITIGNRGEITVSPSGATCISPNNHGASCAFVVDVGASVTLTPSTIREDDRFTGWTTPACAAAKLGACIATCGAGTTTVGASFAHE